MPPTHFCKCDKKRNIVFKDIAKESSDFIDYTDAEKKLVTLLNFLQVN
jgi:hypothetical protein